MDWGCEKRLLWGKKATYRLSKSVVPQDCGCGIVILTTVDNDYHRK